MSGEGLARRREAGNLGTNDKAWSGGCWPAAGFLVPGVALHQPRAFSCPVGEGRTQARLGINMQGPSFQEDRNLSAHWHTL